MDGTGPVLALIDYEAGNLRSIGRALASAGARPVLVRVPGDVQACDAVVLPGVGAFGSAMQRLTVAGFVPWIRAQVASGTPVIGVCLGMQLLFERSEEGGHVQGLGLLPGDVRRLPTGLKVPHMGWNQLALRRTSWITDAVPEGSFVYFVHSYIIHPREEGDVVATTSYGVEFPAIVHRDRVVGLQFHPEKSGETGQRLLRNIVNRLASGAIRPSGLAV